MSLAQRAFHWLPNFGDSVDEWLFNDDYWRGVTVTATIALLFGTGSFVALLVMAVCFLVWGWLRG